MWSEDRGESWSLADFPATENLFLSQMIYDGQQWLAFGRVQGDGGPDQGYVFTSADGRSWGRELNDHAVVSAAHDGSGRWVGVGQTDLFTSSDGLSWEVVEDVPLSGDPWHGVAHDGAATWVAVGDGGIVASSDGGESWISVQIPEDEGWSPDGGIAHSDGRWMVTGASGEHDGNLVHIFTSTDGIIWNGVDDQPGYLLYGLAHDGRGLWVATGLTNDERGLIFTSADGQQWTSRSVPGFARVNRPIYVL